MLRVSMKTSGKEKSGKEIGRLDRIWMLISDGRIISLGKKENNSILYSFIHLFSLQHWGGNGVDNVLGNSCWSQTWVSTSAVHWVSSFSSAKWRWYTCIIGHFIPWFNKCLLIIYNMPDTALELWEQCEQGKVATAVMEFSGRLCFQRWLYQYVLSHILFFC